MNVAGESISTGAIRSESVVGKTLHGEMLNPELVYSGGVGGVWLTAYDNSYLKVNSDGTGGSVSSGGTVGRWEDRSGNGNHVSQSTANIRPVFRTGDGVSFFWATDTTTRQARLTNPSIDAIPRTNCSGGFVYGGLCCANAAPIVDLGSSELAFNTGVNSTSRFMRYFNGAAHVNTLLVTSGRKCVVTWRSNGSDLVIRVNGSEYSLGSALGSVDMTRLNIGTFNGGAPRPIRVYEVVVFDEDIGSSGLLGLELYLRSNIGGYDTQNTVLWYGDSLSCGVGSETGVSVQDYVTNRQNHLWYIFAADGGYIFAPHITAVQSAALKGSTEGVVVLWAGTNDINSGARTGAQCAADLKAYSDTCRAAGCKVVVCTLQDFPNNNSERLACNAQIATDSASYDAIADLAAATELDDCTDTTYFTSDQVHLKDAGFAVVGGLIQTAMSGI